MGQYRSDIRIMIKEEDKEEFNKILDKYELEPDEVKCYTTNIGYLEILPKLDLVDYQFNYINWNPEEFEEIQALIDFIDTHNCAYLRIGEREAYEETRSTLTSNYGYIIDPYYTKQVIGVSGRFDEKGDDINGIQK